MSLPKLTEDPRVLEDLIQDVFDDLQRSKVQLLAKNSALLARNQDLEDYVPWCPRPQGTTGRACYYFQHDDQQSLSEQRKISGICTQMSLTAQDMRRTINNLLLFAKVNAAEAPVQPVHMERGVANVQGRLSHLIREQQARIVVREMWPLAMGYELWIEEVWANYFSNALKYGGHPPCLELGASTGTDSMVRFWVRDNGPGIAPAVYGRLFTSWDEIDRLNIPEHSLGLPIVQRIIEKLSGQVGVESEAGMGSLFFFTLPAVQSSHPQKLAASYPNPELETSCSTWVV